MESRLLDPILLSRLQFSVTIMFHIIYPVLTIGLSIFLVIFELFWLRTKKEIYYRHLRFWGRLFLLNFGIGVVTGIVMEFQFGTNWAGFSRFAGGFFGNILGYEGAMAFAAEAAALALMMFGWGKVSHRVHFTATCIVAFAATLSAFWIMDANSWMQAPTGVVLNNGRMEVVSYTQAIFNPFLFPSFFHKWFACLQISLMMLAGISAWYIRKRLHTDFFLRSFKIGLAAAIIVTPLQIILGDYSAGTVYKYQPSKGAAMESDWETNKKGFGAPWAIVAWPDPKNERNSFEIKVPYVLSILSTHTLKGTVVGLRDIPDDERPPILLPFYSFRLMVGIGLFLFFLMTITLWQWYKGRLTVGSPFLPTKLFSIWFLTIPLGYVAMEAGWIVREVGRQPWSIYKLFRTSDGVSKLEGPEVLTSLIVFSVIYILLFGTFLYFVRKIIHEGPDLKSPVPFSDVNKAELPDVSIDNR